MLKGEICMVIYLIIVRMTLFVAYMHGRCNACFLVYGNVVVGEVGQNLILSTLILIYLSRAGIGSADSA